MAETVRMIGNDEEEIEAYLAWPLTPGAHAGVVVIHPVSGYGDVVKRFTRRLADESYVAICPDLHHRLPPRLVPDPGGARLDLTSPVRTLDTVTDEIVVGDVEGAIALLRSIPTASGKVGVLGFSSGGRQAFLAACRLPLDAAVDCYGPFVAARPPDGLPLRIEPVVGMAQDLSCPLLGLFGADDAFPSPAETALLAAELTRRGKPFEFHTYDGAGHAFFANDRPSYRPHAAVDGWQRIRDFFARHLAV